MTNILLIVMIIIFFLIGFVGIIVPIIPSLPVIWIGILVYAILTNFQNVTIFIVIITGALMIIGTVFDFIAGIFGAKIYGASWVGILGALIGGVIGFVIFNVLGMLIGTFLGTFIGEYLKYNKLQMATKAGIGTILGFVFGIILKIFISFAMIGFFVFSFF